MYNNLENMLKSGFTKKFALYYLNLLDKENSSNLYEKDFLEYAHSNGFLAESLSQYNLKDYKMSQYMSESDYYKVWPLNSWTRVWINDKLTLKYMLANTEFSDIMPEYYFYNTENGLRALIDNNTKDQTFEGFCELLKDKKVFACKPCNGSGSQGFFKIEFNGKDYLVNGKTVSKFDLEQFLLSHPNYVFTEYLRPEKSMAKIDPNIHTIRLVVLNKDGLNPAIVGGYLRFASNMTGEVNYIHSLSDFKNSFMIFTDINFKTGEFGNAVSCYSTRVEPLSVRPDSKQEIKGTIPFWDDVVDKVISISKRFFGIEWMGFDIGITDSGVKIMEINSHPGIKYMQIFKPLLADPKVKEYFDIKLEAIDKMSGSEIEKRNIILR